jgi:hypothetical protein
MNKFIIEESEKNRILGMHKSLMYEQVTSLKDKLQKFIDDGCFGTANVKVVPMTATNPDKQFAIKVESTSNPGKFRYYFLDYSVGEVQNGKFTFLEKQWECDPANIANKTANKDELEKVKKEGGWSTLDELVTAGDTRANIVNPEMYEKKTVAGVDLYRRKASSGISDALTPDQKKIIDKWKQKGYKFKDELDGEELKTWVSQTVSTKSEGFFPQDLVMYYDPKVNTDVAITQAFTDAVESQTPTDKEDCKKAIEAYYMAFKKKKRIEPNMINAMKEKVMACKNEYYGEWGVLGGGSKTDEYVDMLMGKKSGGPSSYGDDSIWRIK